MFTFVNEKKTTFLNKMTEDTSINERVIQIMKLKNMSPSQFADITRLNRATVSQLTANRNNPSFSTIMNILETFPEIDANWLLLGRKSTIQNTEKQEDNIVLQNNQIDIFDTQQTENQSSVELKNNQSQKNEVISQESNTISKKIEKIVIFYTDRSFSEYKPE